MTWLTGLFTNGATAPAAWGMLLLLAALLAVIVFVQLRRSRSGLFMSVGRNRRPRLAVMDATAVDNRRRLVLVRRDGVEHLILIGGTNDLVIEQNIDASAAIEEAEQATMRRAQRSRGKRQQPKPSADAVPATPSPTPVPAPERPEVAPTPAVAAAALQPAGAPSQAGADGHESPVDTAMPPAATAAPLAASAASRELAPHTPPAERPPVAQAGSATANGHGGMGDGDPQSATRATPVTEGERDPVPLDELPSAHAADPALAGTAPNASPDGAMSAEEVRALASTDEMMAEISSVLKGVGETMSLPLKQDQAPMPANIDIAGVETPAPSDIDHRPVGPLAGDEAEPELPVSADEAGTGSDVNGTPGDLDRFAEPRPEPAPPAALPIAPTERTRNEAPGAAAETDAAGTELDQPPASNVTPLAPFAELRSTAGEWIGAEPATTAEPIAVADQLPAHGSSDEPPADNPNEDEAAQDHVEAGTTSQEPSAADKADDLKSEMERLLDQLVSATRAQK